MRDKFIEISLNDLIAKDILYQHDKGQVVRFVEEIGDGTLVLFNNSNVKEDAVLRYVENCSVEIPDRLLETEGSLVVTVKLVDSNSETTQKVVKIKIKSGSKQNEEIEPENQQTFIEQIQGIMNSTKSIAEEVQERADNGEFDGRDGYTPVKGKDYFTDAEVNQIKNDTREQVVTEITPTLDSNLKSAKDYTDNAIIRDFKDVSYDESTATFIFTRHDDTTFTVDLPIEQTVKDGRYDDKTAELVLVLVSGQEIRIPVSGLIDDYIGVDSATIQVVISADNKITCNIIGGTISKTLLTTELQEEIDGKANRSEMSNLVQEVGGKLLELATTDKESYVAAINELNAKTKMGDWELITEIDVTEEIGTIEVTTNSEGNPFAFDDIYVVATNVVGAGNWILNFKTTTSSSNSNILGFMNANAVTSTARHFFSKIERCLGISVYEYDSSYKNATGYTNTINKGTVFPKYECNDETKINWVRIFFSSTNTITSGKIRIYGRNRR